MTINVHIRTPYSIDRNLGKTYNEQMALIPDGDTACFIDGDVCFLTPDYGHILNRYANEYPDNVLTCWTNRIHELSVGQKANIMPNMRDSIEGCIRLAMAIKETTATEIVGCVSGFLLVIPKHIWQQHPFSETNTYRPDEPNLLGVDNEWTNRIRKAGVRILRMDSLLVWHSYRLLDGSKKHLL